MSRSAKGRLPKQSIEHSIDEVFILRSPEARVSILRIHSRKMSLQRGINLRSLAEKMGNCSGAEVRGICTEAGMYALRERRQHVTQEDFELAVAKVLRKANEGSMSSNKLFN